MSSVKPLRVLAWSLDQDSAFESSAAELEKRCAIAVVDSIHEHEMEFGVGKRDEVGWRCLHARHTVEVVNWIESGRIDAILTADGRISHPNAAPGKTPDHPNEIEAAAFDAGLQILSLSSPIDERSPEIQALDVYKPEPALYKSKRMLLGREEGARAGKHQSGPAPYGYQRDYTKRGAESESMLAIHPEEAAVVRAIFRDYLRLKSMKKLIEHLDSQGLRTRRRKQWSRAGVCWILKNETYLGRVHFGEIKAAGLHPPIVSPIIFNKVKKLMRANNLRGGKTDE